MPIWNFKCEKDHEFEHMCSYNDRSNSVDCPECGAEANYIQTFCTNFQYGDSYNSFGADRHRWNLRENKRLGTRGKNYD